MKKWIPIILGTIGSFFILKAIFKLDQKEQKVIIASLSTQEVRKALPVQQEIIQNPTPNALNPVPVGPYLESGKVKLNSKR